MNFLKALSGYKTYIVALVTIAYGIAQWWSGAMDQNTAMAMILGGGGLGALRHGISTSTAPAIAVFLAIGFTLALGACSSTSTPNVADVFKQGCAAVAYADGAFQAASPALIASGKLAAADVEKEKVIFASVSSTCANPPADAATAGLALLGQASAIYLMLSPKA